MGFYVLQVRAKPLREQTVEINSIDEPPECVSCLDAVKTLKNAVGSGRYDMTDDDTKIPASGPPDSADKRLLMIEVAPSAMATMKKINNYAFIFTRFATLDASTIARIMPDIVLAPLLGKGFDIMDVAAHLVSLGYSGPLRAVTGQLPNPAAVLAELRANCVGLEIDLLILPEDDQVKG